MEMRTLRMGAGVLLLLLGVGGSATAGVVSEGRAGEKYIYKVNGLTVVLSEGDVIDGCTVTEKGLVCSEEQLAENAPGGKVVTELPDVRRAWEECEEKLKAATNLVTEKDQAVASREQQLAGLLENGLKAGTELAEAKLAIDEKEKKFEKAKKALAESETQRIWAEFKLKEQQQKSAEAEEMHLREKNALLKAKKDEVEEIGKKLADSEKKLAEVDKKFATRERKLKDQEAQGKVALAEAPASLGKEPAFEQVTGKISEDAPQVVYRHIAATQQEEKGGAVELKKKPKQSGGKLAEQKDTPGTLEQTPAGTSTVGDVAGDHPEASSRLLTEDELKGWKVKDLKMLRNEIFARHSYRFKTKELQDHFASQSWYSARHDDVNPMITDIERANIALLLKMERGAH